MVAAKSVNELIAWQLSDSLRERIFSATATGKCLGDPEFRKQIRRAAQRAPALIAEGFIRYTPNEFVHYLRMARGELGEVQNHLRHSRSQQYFSAAEDQELATLSRRAMAATTRLLQSKLPLLKKNRGTPRPPTEP